MARINENARTGKELLSDGVMGYVRWAQFTQGHSQQEIRRELHRRYPNANKQALDSVMGLASTSKKNASTYNRASNGYKMDRSYMGTNHALPNAYRWVVNVTLREPESGLESHYMAVVNSNSNLSKEEIARQAAIPAKSQYAHGSGKDKYDMPEMPDNPDIEIRFVSVECRTC